MTTGIIFAGRHALPDPQVLIIPHDRRHALVDYFNSNGDQAHVIFDLRDGSVTDLPSLAEFHDTYLSPDGNHIAATQDNGLTIFNYHHDSDTPTEKTAGPTNLDGIVGSVAWNPDSTRMAIDIFGSGQLAFITAHSLDEDAPRWRMADFGTNDSITGLAWSPDGQYIAINVGNNVQHEYYRTGSVRVMLTHTSNMTSALCRIAGSDWTSDEWRKYVGDHAQFSVCN